MQDLRLIFKRNIDSFVNKDLCKFPFEEKNEFLRFHHRALGRLICFSSIVLTLLYFHLVIFHTIICQASLPV